MVIEDTTLDFQYGYNDFRDIDLIHKYIKVVQYNQLKIGPAVMVIKRK